MEIFGRTELFGVSLEIIVPITIIALFFIIFRKYFIGCYLALGALLATAICADILEAYNPSLVEKIRIPLFVVFLFIVLKLRKIPKYSVYFGLRIVLGICIVIYQASEMPLNSAFGIITTTIYVLALFGDMTVKGQVGYYIRKSLVYSHYCRKLARYNNIIRKYERDGDFDAVLKLKDSFNYRRINEKVFKLRAEAHMEG